MPLLLLLLLVLPLLLVALMPLILIQRYRMGSARRLARPWVATLNVALTALSVVLFLFHSKIPSELQEPTPRISTIPISISVELGPAQYSSTAHRTRCINGISPTHLQYLSVVIS